MRARAVVVVALFALAFVAGCGPSSTPPSAVTVAPVDVMPSGAQEVTSAPVPANNDCDREASLYPGPMPPPGAMPPGSTMAAIAERGRLIVGVDQNTNLFGYRNPSSGQLEGFDIDVAREIARAIFGDPDSVDLRVVEADQRVPALQSGQVDLVVRTFSITCERKDKVAFSTTYFVANQRILALKGSGIKSSADLAGKRVCAVRGTTSLPALSGLDPRPRVFAVNNWTDCLVMLQQAQVDAISTDDSVLWGLKMQDPNAELVGGSIGLEPYGIGINKEHTDLVRFVNGVLEQMRADGTWERLYDKWLREFAPSPGPPVARYQDGPP
ncbi:MAG TPA: glutamate ABC transporter substrate-binding protein [Mycobacterium sp.]|nr:glutamate ABC transporter substrate-binding protein [Mycobacterium sp.]